MRYGALFPNDITYTIGKSDYHKDWFFEQVPHGLSMAWQNPAAKDPANQRFGWVKAGNRRRGHVADDWPGPGDDLDDQVQHGQGRARQGDPARGAGRRRRPRRSGRGRQRPRRRHDPPDATNALRYNTDTGVWQEYKQPFDAALLKQGENEMQLTVPAGELTSGVVYDYLRLELDEQ